MGRYKWVVLALIIIATVIMGVFVWLRQNKSPLVVGRREGLYTTHGQVNKWYPSADTLEIKVSTKIISLKLKEYPQATVIGPNPKNRYNTTILVKSQYTKEEWGRAFCKDDVLLIGTKENVWKKITNYMQVTPDFVNVEDRPCYNLPAE